MLFIPISLAMMIAMPLFRVPDEARHLGRIWQISIGQWMPDDRNAGVFISRSAFSRKIPPDMTLWQMAKTAGDSIDMARLEEADVGGGDGLLSDPTTLFSPRRSEWRWFGW